MIPIESSQQNLLDSAEDKMINIEYQQSLSCGKFLGNKLAKELILVDEQAESVSCTTSSNCKKTNHLYKYHKALMSKNA